MINAEKMNAPQYGETSEFAPVCCTLSDASEILHTADRIPDESTKAPLIEGVKKMVQNVLDALNGRRTDGLVETDPEDD